MAEYNYAGMNPVPFVAGGAITANRAVVLDSTVNRVVAGSAIAGNAIGVALDTVTAAGQQVPVQIGGVAMVCASAAITLGDEVMVTASGSGKVSTSSGATALSIGIALAAAAADGDIIPVLLNVPAVKTAANS